ncbi:MAG: hypothetical protein VZR95_03525 [Alphaproteobacteria bacterium]
MEKNIITIKEFRQVMIDSGCSVADKVSTMPDEILSKQLLIEELKMDSLDIVELVMTIELDRRVSVPDKAIDQWVKSDGTVQALIDIINANAVPKAA